MEFSWDLTYLTTQNMTDFVKWEWKLDVSEHI